MFESMIETISKNKVYAVGNIETNIKSANIEYDKYVNKIAKDGTDKLKEELESLNIKIEKKDEIDELLDAILASLEEASTDDLVDSTKKLNERLKKILDK
jgi:uncharacterized membrane-anchored protein YjiN (DUF445 family)